MDAKRVEASLRRRGWDIDAEGCWLLRGALTNSGYTSISAGSFKDSGHRAAYRVWKGDIPAGLVVRHKCDKQRCINPECLELGTHGDNANDRVVRDRVKHESEHWNARLEHDTVIEIYKAAQIGALSQQHIAAVFGVSQMAVSLIKRKRRWRRFLEQAEAEGIL